MVTVTRERHHYALLSFEPATGAALSPVRHEPVADARLRDDVAGRLPV